MMVKNGFGATCLGVRRHRRRISSDFDGGPGELTKLKGFSRVQ